MINKGFKLVNTFLFSEPYESDLLFLKLLLEDRGGDEWVILENSYTLQGSWKGFHARKVISTEDRFKPFLKKITILEREYVNHFIPENVVLDEYGLKAEHVQRDFGYDYILDHYKEHDWVLVSDVDEMMDFTDDKRYEEFLLKLNNSETGFLKLPTKRFWYDFDNEYLPLLGIPICTKQYLISHNKKLSQIRFENRSIIKRGWNNIIQFEYSSCFSKEFLLRKFYTSGHTGLGPNDLEKSLFFNHRPVSPVYIGRKRKDKKFFFETVELTSENSPAIVRNNLPRYKTHVINKDYRQARREAYPEAFRVTYHFYNKLEDLLNYIRKKTRFLLRRLGVEHFFYS